MPALAPVLIEGPSGCVLLEGEAVGVTSFAAPDEIEVELESVELDVLEIVLLVLDVFETPAIALILTPNLFLQHVELVDPQHQLPSAHCNNGVFVVGSPPVYRRTNVNILRI